MKKLFLSLVLFAMATLAVNAQSGFGIRGGANFFRLGGGDVSENDYTNRTGFHAGFYAALPTSGGIVVEPGLYYSVKGTQADNAVNSRLVLNYVDLPILVRLKAGEAFNFFVGPQVSFLTDSTLEGDLGGSTFSFGTNSIRGTDTGLVFGLGYHLSQGFNIQGSYDYGLTTVFKDSDADVYNRGFKISLGYTF